MRRNIKLAMLVMAGAIAVISAARPAQPTPLPLLPPPQSGSPAPYGYFPAVAGSTLASCPAPIAGVTATCYVATGWFLSTGGGAYAQLCTVGLAGCGGGASVGVLTVDGVKPGPTGNITLVASIPNVSTTVTAPTLTFAGNGAATVGVPSATSTATAPVVTASGN